MYSIVMPLPALAITLNKLGKSFFVVKLLPAPGDPEDDRYRLLQAVSDFLNNAAQPRPLMLVLEDLRDADRSTLALLTHVASNLARARLLIVGTYRDVEVASRHSGPHRKVAHSPEQNAFGEPR